MINGQTKNKLTSHSCTNVFLIAFRSIPSKDSASGAPLYPVSDQEATYPTASLGSAPQQYTQMQSDPATCFLLISDATQHTTHVLVLQCQTATVINFCEPCIATHPSPHQMLIFCGFRSVPG